MFLNKLIDLKKGLINNTFPYTQGGVKLPKYVSIYTCMVHKLAHLAPSRTGIGDIDSICVFFSIILHHQMCG